jgi:WD40 repeat protein
VHRAPSMPQTRSMDARTLYLQALHNGHVELELRPSPRLEAELQRSDHWLRLKEPTHAWPPEMLTRESFPVAPACIAVPPIGALHGDQNLLAVGMCNGAIHVCDLQAGTPSHLDRERKRLTLRFRNTIGFTPVSTLSWSADGLLAAIHGRKPGSGFLEVWAPWRSDQPLYPRPPLDPGLAWEELEELEFSQCIAWSRDGLLAVGNLYGRVGVWDAKRPEKLMWCGRGYDGWAGCVDTVVSMAWSPSGRLATGYYSGNVAIWEVGGSDQPCWRGQVHMNQVASLSWAPSEYLASGSLDGTVAVWEMGKHGRLICLNRAQHSQPTVASWSPDGRFLLCSRPSGLAVGESACRIDPDRSPHWFHEEPVAIGGEISVWEPLRRGSLLWQPPRLDEEEGIRCVTWSPDGSLIAGTADMLLMAWEPGKSQSPIWVGRGHDAEVNCMAWSQNGRLVSGSMDWSVAVWVPQVCNGLPHGSQSDQVSASSSCRAVAWSNDRGLLAFTNPDWLVVWEQYHATEPALASWRPNDTELYSLSWSHDGRLASGGLEGNVVVWDPRQLQEPLWCGRGSQGSFLESPDGYSMEARVVSLAWSPDDRLLAGAWGVSPAVWEPMGSELAIWHGSAIWDGISFNNEVGAVGWSVDGRLASGDADGVVMVWDVSRNNRAVWRGLGHRAAVVCLGWSPDGRIVTGDYEGNVAAWAPDADDQPLWGFGGLWGTVRAVTWAPNGRWVAVGSELRELIILATDNGTPIARFRVNAGVSALTWSPDSKEIWAADRGAGFGYPRVYHLACEGRW